MDTRAITTKREAASSASSSLATMPSRLRLDMSFNRYPAGRFASDVDPLAIGQPPQNPTTPSVSCEDPSMAELAATLGAFKFPVRTDGVRGLLWGPFKDEPETEDEEGLLTLSDGKQSSRTYISWSAANAEAEATSPWTKRQRIFPIVRPPLLIRIKPTLKRRRELMEEAEDPCLRLARAKLLDAEDEVTRAIDVVPIAFQRVSITQRKSRITLSASSRLKYTA